ncbi:MAG: glutamate synthase [Clostridiales bacterium]|jgi:glutamate synthase domain-containing protein 3|nr:glutamate synthase [Clostridiales bacterium]
MRDVSPTADVLSISAEGLSFKELNDKLRATNATEIVINNAAGQRYIAAGAEGRRLTINGTPGNALAAYMDGAEIIVNGNAQDAVGDTMNDGRVIVHGSAGDALGYGMRGGLICVKGCSGYRTGIHMKQYQDKSPVIVIGESCGSFLGEYMAGGTIVVLGIGLRGQAPVGNFTGTGMHGGEIYIRSDEEPKNLPAQVSIDTASNLDDIRGHVRAFAQLFGCDADELLSGNFFVLRPNAKNPYHSLYTQYLR